MMRTQKEGHTVLNCETTQLILIDIQDKLLKVMHERDALLLHVLQMLQGARELGLPIVWSEQYPEGIGATLPAITELLPGLKPISKRAFSCCAHPPLLDAIVSTGRKQILLVGIETHVCVYQTAMDLLARGMQVEVVADCAASRNPVNHQLGLARVQQAGGRITSVEIALFELLRTADNPHFKAISRIVK
jgi:nicotinamidase-related amidase